MTYSDSSTRTREDIADTPMPGDTIERRGIDKHVQADTIVVTDVDGDVVTYVCGGIVCHDEYGPTSNFTTTRDEWSRMVRTKDLHHPRSTPDWAATMGGVR